MVVLALICRQLERSDLRLQPFCLGCVGCSSHLNLSFFFARHQDRIIICGGEVKDEMAQVLIAQMLYLSNESAERPSIGTAFSFKFMLNS